MKAIAEICVLQNEMHVFKVAIAKIFSALLIRGTDLKRMFIQ